MKKVLALVAATGLALSLAACSSGVDPIADDGLLTAADAGNDKPAAPSSLVEFKVKLDDGRILPCTFMSNWEGTKFAVGGPSCDWANAKQDDGTLVVSVPSNGVDSQVPPAMVEYDKTLADGTILHCIFISDYQGTQFGIGGPSCDWENATRPAPR